MDHIGGIEDLFNEFSPANFWDTDNACVKDGFGNGGPHDEQDWLFYKALRDNRPTESPKRLVLYSGKRGKYYNQAEDGSGGGDGIYILSPTKELMKAAIELDDYNDSSYVLVYKSNGGRIIVAGDSHDATWEHILANHYNDVANAEVLLAPHHGRKSNRTYQFLDVVKPKITLFGNANHEHLAYGAWNSRQLQFITNNQANCVVINTDVKPMQFFVTNEVFARSRNPQTYYSPIYHAYFLGYLVE